MSDHIDQLTASHETELQETIDAALDHADSTINWHAVSANMAAADEDGATDHERNQLALLLDTDEPEEGALAAALDTAALASFFAAILALAGAQAGHVANTNGADAVTARNTAIQSFRAGYLSENTAAVRATAERMLSASGDPDSRAAQIRRVMGLSRNQARSLNTIRDALVLHVAEPRLEAADILAPLAGNITAGQRQMLVKAIHQGTNAKQAEAILDRHAKALRNARTKAVAGNAAHQIAESAKLTGWQIAQAFGALPANQRRYWRTAGDERVRVSHAQVPGMNPNGVPLDQPFATPLGPCFTPPLEHGCRCKATLKPST
ncbi:phage minor head protein [Novosphingobium sp. M1R2S20]|uniref:Phage minor head protein n=1 Tax=Novosphingobium rhizovicinum TaxID=3228928 RepID=A0ABV3R7N6_9SPHN